MKKNIVLSLYFLAILFSAQNILAMTTDVTYIYDDLNRLSQIVYDWATITYTYDDAGNRKTEVIDSQTPEVNISRAVCRGSSVYIQGTGFGEYDPAPESGIGLVQLNRNGLELDCIIRIWTDTTINTTCTECSDRVTVYSSWGQDMERVRRLRPRKR